MVGVVPKCSERTVGGGMCITEANSKREPGRAEVARSAVDPEIYYHLVMSRVTIQLGQLSECFNEF